MPMVPATPVLPADMLRPADIVLKFSPRSLAGLGDFEFDPNTGDIVSVPYGGTAPYIDPETGLPVQFGGGPIESVTLNTSGGYTFGVGTPGTFPSNSTWTPPPPGTYSIPSGVARTSSGTINTGSTDAATLNLINTLARAGFSLAQIATMQPGTVIQTGPGGTSTILRQSAAGQAPVPVTGFFGGVTAGANQGASLGLLAVVAVGAFLLLSRGR